MLTVVWSALRILALVLLILAGAIAILLFMILFLPVVYRISARLQGEELELAGKVRWLFGLLRADYSYPSPGRLVVKLLFFTIYEDSAKPQDTPKVQAAEDRNEASDGETILEEQNIVVQHDMTEAQEKVETKTTEEQHESSEADKRTAKDEEAATKSIIDKLRYTFHNSYDKIKEILANVAEDKNVFGEERTRLLFQHVFFRVRSMLKSVRPRKLKGKLAFGTGSPDTTGYLFGVYGMIAHRLGDQFHVVPDFERKILEADFSASGHIIVAVLLWHGIFLGLDRNLKWFIAKMKKQKHKIG